MTQEKINKVKKIAYIFVLLSITLWLLATVIPSYFQTQGQPLLAFLIRKVFSPVCHQMVDRSFWLWGYPLAVCSRCSGIYSGVLLGAIFYPLLKSYQKSDLLSRSYLIVMLLPTSIDFLFGALHLVENTHFSRFFTGVLAGFGLASYIVLAIISLVLEITETILDKGKGRGLYGSK